MVSPVIVNYSVSAGDNAELDFSVETEIVVDSAEISWALYAQSSGAPSGDALVEKLLSYGITFEEEDGTTTFTVELEQADTIELALGNYYYEAIAVDGEGKNRTLAVGLLTLTGWSSELTSRAMKLRFPELVDYDDSVLEFAISEATTAVDDTWIESDIAPARMLLAAHFAASASQDLETGGDTNISSESIGRISRSYGRAVGAERTGLLGGTTYGQRFLVLQAGSHRGPIII